MAKFDHALDEVFHALADPTRRAVLRRLGESPASVSELAEPFSMALPSFVKHLAVLEESGLVSSKKEGRVRTYQLKPKNLNVAEGWLSEQRSLWESRTDRFVAYVEALAKEEKER